MSSCKGLGELEVCVPGSGDGCRLVKVDLGEVGACEGYGSIEVSCPVCCCGQVTVPRALPDEACLAAPEEEAQVDCAGHVLDCSSQSCSVSCPNPDAARSYGNLANRCLKISVQTHTH